MVRLGRARGDGNVPFLINKHGSPLITYSKDSKVAEG
jgi:hypothetical protein